MKRFSSLGLVFSLLFAGVILIFSCNKDAPEPPKGVTNRIDLKVDSIKNVLYHDATAFGSAGVFKGITFSQYGHCWDTIEIPTIISNKTELSNLASQSTFTSTLTNLKANKKYYIRSYAKSNNLTVYSEITSFSTKSLEPPTLTTDSTANITSNTITIWGDIKLDGGTTISAKGVCWGLSTNPTLLNQHTESTTQNKSFSTSVTGLTRKTTYHARVYATNQSGTSYGNDIVFNTKAELPIITSIEANEITFNSAMSGGNISSDGSESITGRGVCWSTSPNPTIANLHTSDGLGTGNFTSSITGLQFATKYYARAYATNSVGTSYGNQIEFTTPATTPTITTNSVSAVTSSSATCGGNITSDGGSAITSRGVCWSTSPNPTISDNITQNGSGTGSFTSYLTGLITGTTYYLRSYALNSVGEAYGQEISFNTVLVAIDIDGNIYNTIQIGNQIWLKENLRVTHYNNGDSIANKTTNDLWTNTDTGGYCWYNNDIGNKDVFGALYNFYTVVDTRNLCPLGWHIPSDGEWSTLVNYLGGSSVAGGKLKETGILHWTSPNTGADNSSGFTAVPSGERANIGFFYDIFNNSFLWSSTEYDVSNAYARYLFYNNAQVSRADFEKHLGFSVRCLKN